MRRRDPAYWWLPWYRRPGLGSRIFDRVESLIVVLLALVVVFTGWVTFIHICTVLWPYR